MKFDLLEKIDFDIIILLVLFWSAILILFVPAARDLVIEVTKDALLAYFGYTTKKRQEVIVSKDRHF